MEVIWGKYWAYIGVMLGLYRGYSLGIVLGLHGDNGKENGQYYNG